MVQVQIKAPLPSVAAKKALPPLKKLGSPNKPLTKSDALLLEDSVRSQSPAPPEGWYMSPRTK